MAKQESINTLLDPAIYPAFEIYPGYVIMPQEHRDALRSIELKAKYPAIAICSLFSTFPRSNSGF
jgi:hypothetical protein